MSGSPWRTVSLIAALLLGASCSSAQPEGPAAGSPGAPSSEPQPYPYTTPTPPAEPTAVDGTWLREVDEDLVGGAGKCRRCPPYRLAAGTDVLELDQGVFRIAHRGTGYMAVGHYTVDGDRLTFFNDPNCSSVRGTYAWTVEGGVLHLRVVEDACAFGDLRIRFMTAAPWRRGP